MVNIKALSIECKRKVLLNASVKNNFFSYANNNTLMWLTLIHLRGNSLVQLHGFTLIHSRGNSIGTDDDRTGPDTL